MDKVNLGEKLSLIEDFWSPKAVGAVNDFHVKLVKLKGEFVWHAHEVEDELFLVLKGRLRMQFRDQEVAVGPGSSSSFRTRPSTDPSRTTRCTSSCWSLARR